MNPAQRNSPIKPPAPGGSPVVPRPKNAAMEQLNKELAAQFQKHAAKPTEAKKPAEVKNPQDEIPQETAPRKNSLKGMINTFRSKVSGKELSRSSQDATVNAPKSSVPASPVTSPRVSLVGRSEFANIIGAIEEMATSEQNFSERMQEAIRRMKYLSADPTQLNNEERNLKFSKVTIHFQNLLNVSASLSQSFFRALEGENLQDKLTAVATCYLSPEYKLYGLMLKECASHSSFLEEQAQTLKANATQMEGLLELRKQSPKFAQLDESNLYIIPLQRMFKHVDLIKAVLKRFSSSTDIHKDLSPILKQTESIANEVNEMQRRKDQNIDAYLNKLAAEIKSEPDFNSKKYSAELLRLAMSNYLEHLKAYSWNVKDFAFVIRQLDEKIQNDPDIKMNAFLLFFENLFAQNNYDNIVRSMRESNPPMLFYTVLKDQIGIMIQQFSDDEEHKEKLTKIRERFRKFKSDIKA